MGRLEIPRAFLRWGSNETTRCRNILNDLDSTHMNINVDMGCGSTRRLPQSSKKTLKEKRDNSINYVLQSAQAAKMIGASRVIVHSGSCGKMTREKALELAKDTVRRCLKAMDEEGLGDIVFCPETMGKINQLGNLDEVLSLCELDERLIPCIDFGHLNARTLGQVNSRESFLEILDAVENRLGIDRLKQFHSHFSKIEYTDNGGEKRHLTFEDAVYGPEFEPLAELIAKKNLSPVFICESAGTQAEDAQAMMEMYRKYLAD